jgi:hypothetical protein
MIDDSRRFVAQLLARSQQSAAEFSVVIADLTARARPQIDAEATVLFKDSLPKCHVGTVRSTVKSAWLIT